MKPGTIVLTLKGACFVIVGAGTPVITNLSQWANSGEWPAKINWVVIIIGGCVGAATHMLSFFSESFSQYKAQSPATTSSATPQTQPGQQAIETKVN